MNSDYYFDINSFRDEINLIEKNIERIFLIEGSLSENRKEHREFSERINLDFSTIECAYKLFRPSNVIEIYTFIERVIKSYVYTILGNHEDEAVNKFINNKIPKDRFVPGSRIEDITKIVNEFTPMQDKLKLFIKIFDLHDSTKIFNNLIDTRHKYAHRGIFDLNYDKDDYKNLIDTLYYIVEELSISLMHIDFRLKLQKNISEIIYSLKKLNECYNKDGCKNFLEEIRKSAKIYIEFEHNINLQFKSEIYNKIIEDIKMLSSIDLRKNSIQNKNTIFKDLKILNIIVKNKPTNYII